MAMTNRNNAKLDCMIYYTLDELVPQDHLVRKMEEALDSRQTEYRSCGSF